jgi:conserved domain protein
MKHNTLFRYLVAFLFCMAGIVQAGAQDAFYVYRNDGGFNAHFFEEVDSMLCSKVDVGGLLHTDYVTQEIYTPDSVYRIPLVAIDSIGFVTPEPVLSDKVVRLEDGLYDYLTAVDGMELTFSTAVPKNLIPKNGQILVCTDFSSQFFEEGFVGKIREMEQTGTGYIVCCDTVNDLTEVFDRLVAVECLAVSDPVQQRAVGSWSSASIPLTLSLNYDTQSSAGVDATLYGALNGVLKATVAYNISKENQYIGLTLAHEWSLSAGINISTDATFFKNGTVKALTPALRFPACLPVLKFQLMGAPFIRGEGHAEMEVKMEGPAHKYMATVTYENGSFSGSNKAFPVSGGMNPTFNSSLSLNGFVQGGYLLDVYLGTIQCLGYVKSAVDFYVGPKLNGDFRTDLGSMSSLDYYNTYKDSKVGLSPLSVDVEAYGEANYFGQPVMRHKFFGASLASFLYNEWYMMPEFSEINMEELDSDNSVRLSCCPSRNVLLPLSLGLGLYDKDNMLWKSWYKEEQYKSDGSGFILEHDFSGLTRNKKYTARPLVRILGGTVSASPSKDINLSVDVRTFKASSVTKTSAVVGGYADGLESAMTVCELGICYNTAGSPAIDNSTYVSSGRSSSGEFNLTLSDLKPNTTYYCTCLAIDGEYYYGDILTFKTKGNTDGHEAVDLGLSVKWATCNVGANSPEEYGGYYAWGETEEKSYYDWSTYKYCNGSYGTMTKYCTNSSWGTVDNKTVLDPEDDVAHVKWGGSWRMPTSGEIYELVNNCFWTWTTQNGVKGYVVTSKSNGNSIFLPAAGGRWYENVYISGSGGYYWSASLGESCSSNAYYLDFYSGHRRLYNLRYDGFSVRPVTE